MTFIKKIFLVCISTFTLSCSNTGEDILYKSTFSNEFTTACINDREYLLNINNEFNYSDVSEMCNCIVENLFANESVDYIRENEDWLLVDTHNDRDMLEVRKATNHCDKQVGYIEKLQKMSAKKEQKNILRKEKGKNIVKEGLRKQQELANQREEELQKDGYASSAF